MSKRSVNFFSSIIFSSRKKSEWNRMPQYISGNCVLSIKRHLHASMLWIKTCQLAADDSRALLSQLNCYLSSWHNFFFLSFWCTNETSGAKIKIVIFLYIYFLLLWYILGCECVHTNLRTVCDLFTIIVCTFRGKNI
jgi:hypothetical protein